MGAPEVFLVCQGCLSDDRRCNVIVGHDLDIFLRVLDPDFDSKLGCHEINCLFLCWECDATLRMIKKYQIKIQKARKVLKNQYLPSLKSKCLSTLKTHTKTKYDVVVNTALQFKEITILKIGPDGNPILDDLAENHNEIKELDVKLSESPKNFDSDDGFNFMDSDSHISDDDPIISLKIKKEEEKHNPYKRKKEKKLKQEDSGIMSPVFDPLARRPERLKKRVETLNFPAKKIVYKKKGRPKKKIKKKKVLKVQRGRALSIECSEPTSSNDGKFKVDDNEMDAPDWLESEDENKEHTTTPVRKTKKKTYEELDPSFIASTTLKKNPYEENSKYTKVHINMDNLLQYFTKYTLTLAEYRSFLEKLSKTPYFMTNRKKCYKCVVTFLDEEDYLQHMTLHSDTGNFTCTVCDLQFVNNYEYRVHTIDHLTVQQCNICKQTCGLQHSLNVHMATVHREGYFFKCVVCAMMFDSRSAVCQHYDKLHKRLVCNDCGKFQYSRKTMAIHYQSKHVPPACPHCNAKIKNYTYLRTHLILKHNYPEKKKCKLEDMYCVECDKQFNSMMKFKMHTSVVHRPDKTSIRVECKDCGKMISKTFMKVHYDFYHGVPRFKCDICNKPFAKKESMQRHIDVLHLGQRPVKNKPCYICGRLFLTNRILTHHIRTHTGEKPFACDYCPATFAQKAAKYIHYKNVHKRRLDNTCVDNIGDEAMMRQCPTDVYMDMSLVRPVTDCGVDICHSGIMSGNVQ